MPAKLGAMRAVVDLGSNSVKYLMGDFFRGAPRVISNNSKVTRLAEKMDLNGGYLEKSALLRTDEALKLFSKELINAQIEVVATAAARKAKNVEELKKIVKNRLNAETRVITGAEEALWSQRGAKIAAHAVFGENQPLAYIDLGGASTEISFSESNSPSHSFSVGAVSLMEGLGLDTIPTDDETWAAARKKLPSFFDSKILRDLSQFSKTQKNRISIAVGGTLVIAAKLATQDPKNVTDYGIICKREVLGELNERLRPLSREERLALPNMAPGREDLLNGGLLALDFLMNALGSEQTLITPWGLRHGLLFANSGP
jgi:exopolyphosphatase / guanosine-5'-triphosphate,3'-diphosphate pyrophosphatase